MSEEEFLRRMLADIKRIKKNLERFIMMKRDKDQQVYKIGGLTISKSEDDSEK